MMEKLIIHCYCIVLQEGWADRWFYQDQWKAKTLDSEKVRLEDFEQQSQEWKDIFGKNPQYGLLLIQYNKQTFVIWFEYIYSLLNAKFLPAISKMCRNEDYLSPLILNEGYFLEIRNVFQNIQRLL
ncbi:hypothetical protein QNI19_09095 [Cytophagaceae bacterium DM2B3-1]|uniref:Uncharacterized protein n=1 Tax=Xanthocytophaga flava TaxID=3048013 RepID=A0ABT7CJ61_9BACT|nr:hypothetical protein [Xanthocytophaga flavus]MDJ1493087.1 hypothetical protein [Xanthocytophaga flavus]